MIEIVTNFSSTAEQTVVLDRALVKEISRRAIETIKNELPEEAQTVEVLEYVVSEIGQSIKEKKIAL